MSFLSQHPVLIAVLAFVLGQVSMLLVLGLCSSAALTPREEPRSVHAHEPAPRPRRYRLRGVTT